jgi:hypothetical protein
MALPTPTYGGENREGRKEGRKERKKLKIETNN